MIVKNIDQVYLHDLSRKMREISLEMSFKCGEASHLGGALSIIEIMAVIFGKVLDAKKNSFDRFILSKGHGVLALYSALYCNGKISEDHIKSFQTNGSNFIAHPIMQTDLGIESSNGSLGQGLSMGVGIALSYKKRNKNGKIFILVGDGECYEGAIWEAVISASELKLDNLTVIVDCNGFQNDGEIGNDMKYEKLFNKWYGFNWDCLKCDGHNFEELIECISQPSKNLPRVIIAKTVKGKGVKFMENNNDWHHNRLTEKLYFEALDSLS